MVRRVTAVLASADGIISKVTNEKDQRAKKRDQPLTQFTEKIVTVKCRQDQNCKSRQASKKNQDVLVSTTPETYRNDAGRKYQPQHEPVKSIIDRHRATQQRKQQKREWQHYTVKRTYDGEANRQTIQYHLKMTNHCLVFTFRECRNPNSHNH